MPDRLTTFNARHLYVTSYEYRKQDAYMSSVTQESCAPNQNLPMANY